jgi:hypothetical protein
MAKIFGGILMFILCLAVVFAGLGTLSPFATESHRAVAAPVFILAAGFIVVILVLEEIRDAALAAPEKTAAAIVAATRAARKGNGG